MAAITIRSLADDVVEKLKQRAKRNGRSMEAEAREALTRLVAEDDRSGLENVLEHELAPQRWGRTGAEIRAWLDANPRTEEQLRVAKEWADEIDARPYDGNPFRDPWEAAEEQYQQLRKEHGR
ncbi:hypothetical protein L2X99_14275 [Microbacterium sp. KUDC0406]|uniref:FitA-like ribbon-helix-helix domain-containing protein n=1 Tax=Microbacterium sp. KUDC0406 TaxID=2909588 RepID=UPI001F3B3384|nr:hypothetical protein [Microbacterium sp. KUDC0406]UJP09569.1 hypothetical protein L2X99_14275 [Microbacterium sp. KUDC0406]